MHERGAPHLADPSKLLESARRLYGDDMGLLWGEVLPVPEEQIRPLHGGEIVEGFRVAATPGHASHHVCYLHEETRDAYVGDMAGVRVPPFEHTLAPTPPPDIDVEAWLDSLHTIAGWAPQRLCLTHFGPVTDVEEQLHRLRTALLDQAELARDAAARRSSSPGSRSDAARPTSTTTRSRAWSRPRRSTSSTWASSATGARRAEAA